MTKVKETVPTRVPTHTVAPYERPTNSEALAAAGRKGSSKRHEPETYARSIVKRWPDLTEEQRTGIRAILEPVI
jgi:hypothetical protein